MANRAGQAKLAMAVTISYVASAEAWRGRRDKSKMQLQSVIYQ
jgi:hypothetical protein